MKTWLSLALGQNQEQRDAASALDTNSRSRSLTLDSYPTYFDLRGTGDLRRALISQQQSQSQSQSQWYSDSRDPLSKRVNALCISCRNIDFQGRSTNRTPIERYEIRFDGFSELQQSSVSCPLCRVLYRTLPNATPNFTPPDLTSAGLTFDFVPLYADGSDGQKTNVVEGLWLRSKAKYVHLVFSVPADNPASLEIERRPPVSDYNSRPAYDVARRWLGECLNHHDLCPKGIDVPLPTRVVDVGDASHDPWLFSPRKGDRGQYLALSYCWGQSQPVLLTRERLNNWVVVYPLQTLPPTLRDAIIICRELGFQYIWIDALCIVQDSLDCADWKNESANMDQIYGNAILTIAAAAATSTSQGIFSFSKPERPPTCSLPYHLPNGQIGAVDVEAYDTDQPPQEPLDSRAWALQEALLSVRVLRYGSEQMSWKCSEKEENANGPLTSSNKQPNMKGDTWVDIVIDYTARKLTYSSDHLSALSGYAKFLASRRLYDEYLAGLWKTELLAQLLWYRSSKSTPHPRPSPSCAPSWSWASIDSPVRFSYRPPHYQSNTSIVSVSLVRSKLDPFGQIDTSQRNFLQLYGCLRRLVYQDFLWDNEGSSIYFTRKKIGPDGTKGQANGEVILDVMGPFDITLRSDENLFFICLHMTPTCGLLLAPIYDRNDVDVVYERVGFAEGDTFEEWFFEDYYEGSVKII